MHQNDTQIVAIHAQECNGSAFFDKDEVFEALPADPPLSPALENRMHVSESRAGGEGMGVRGECSDVEAGGVWTWWP